MGICKSSLHFKNEVQAAFVFSATSALKCCYQSTFYWPSGFAAFLLLCNEKKTNVRFIAKAHQRITLAQSCSKYATSF